MKTATWLRTYVRHASHVHISVIHCIFNFICRARLTLTAVSDLHPLVRRGENALHYF